MMGDSLNSDYPMGECFFLDCFVLSSPLAVFLVAQQANPSIECMSSDDTVHILYQPIIFIGKREKAAKKTHKKAQLAGFFFFFRVRCLES